jgi:hypothetical protein
MNLDEALAVYLYLKNNTCLTRNRDKFDEAWSVICKHANRELRREQDAGLPKSR